MSVVNFDNARITDHVSGSGGSPFRVENLNFGANFYKTYPYKENGKTIDRTKAARINRETSFVQYKNGENQYYLFTGVFSDSGTSFVISNNTNYQGWKVSNIKFNTGDVYAFVIVINVPES